MLQGPMACVRLAWLTLPPETRAYAKSSNSTDPRLLRVRARSLARTASQAGAPRQCPSSCPTRSALPGPTTGRFASCSAQAHAPTLRRPRTSRSCVTKRRRASAGRRSRGHGHAWAARLAQARAGQRGRAFLANFDPASATGTAAFRGKKGTTQSKHAGRCRRVFISVGTVPVRPDT